MAKYHNPKTKETIEADNSAEAAKKFSDAVEEVEEVVVTTPTPNPGASKPGTPAGNTPTASKDATVTPGAGTKKVN